MAEETPIQIEILLFAQLREAFGQRQMSLELPAGSVARDVAQTVLREHANLQSLPLSFAVNEEFVPSDHALAPGDCVALIPPVAGG